MTRRSRPKVIVLACVAASIAAAPGAAVHARADAYSAAQPRVTIAARPSIVAPDHPITLYGTVASRRPGEEVEIQTKECGQTFFRGHASTRTELGGSWSSEFFPGITTRVRAVWNGRASRSIVVRQRAMLRFAASAGDRSRFVVSVVARAQFWRRYVLIERETRTGSRWLPYRSVRLTHQEAPGEFVWTSGEFRADLPKGTRLRAVLPASQAGPCYLTSTSLTVRVD